MTTQEKEAFDNLKKEEREKSYEVALSTFTLDGIAKFHNGLSNVSRNEFKNFVADRREKPTDNYYQKGYTLDPTSLTLVQLGETFNLNANSGKKSWGDEMIDEEKIIEDKKDQKKNEKGDAKSNKDIANTLLLRASKIKNIEVDDSSEERQLAIKKLDEGLKAEMLSASFMDYEFGKVLANKSSIFESYKPFINKLKNSIADFKEMAREQLNLLAPFYGENVTKYYTEAEISQYLYMSPFLGSFTKLNKRVITFTLIVKKVEKKDKLKMQEIYSDLFTKAGITFNAKFFNSLQSKCLEIILCLLKYSIKPIGNKEQFYSEYELNYLITQELLQTLKTICSYKLESVWDAEALRAFSQEHTNKVAFFDVLTRLKDDSALPYLKVYLFNNLVDKFVFQLRGLESGKPAYPSETLLKENLKLWSDDRFLMYYEMLTLKKDRVKKTIEKNLGIRKTKNQGDNLRDYQHACYGYILKAIKKEEFSYNSNSYKVTKEE